MNDVQTMPGMQLMITKSFTVRDWLLYYKNMWTRNLAARLTDVQGDITLKKADAEALVDDDMTKQEVPVKVRLEHRKIIVQDCINVLASIDSLLALDDATLAATYSKDALKVADDMIPKAPVAPTAPATLKYKVVSDTGIQMPDNSVAAKDAIVELDPMDQNTIAMVGSGSIVLEAAPSAEATV